MPSRRNEGDLGRCLRARLARFLLETCRLCATPLKAPCLDLGRLPLCNRFSDPSGNTPVHRLAVTGCDACGLVQLIDPVPADIVRPRVPWIRYNEPTAHIPDLVKRIIGEFGRVPKVALGIGPFEGPLLEALAQAGAVAVESPAPFHPHDGLFPYLESWQAALSAGVIAPEMATTPSPELVSCRYLLEHCHDPLSALRNLATSVDPDGLLLIEVPDSAKFLKARDYCFLWEEHVAYFTEATLEAMCRRAGLRPVAMLRYPGDLEDALVVLAKPEQAAKFEPTGSGQLFDAFRSALAPRRDAIRRTLIEAGGPARVVLFGAGHHAAMFANALGVADLIGYVVDDDPNKIGMTPPGFASPVRSSKDLLDDPSVALCLLAVSPRSDARVREILAPLADRGSEMRSIYVMGPNSIFSGANN